MYAQGKVITKIKKHVLAKGADVFQRAAFQAMRVDGFGNAGSV